MLVSGAPVALVTIAMLISMPSMREANIYKDGIKAACELPSTGNGDPLSKARKWEEIARVLPILWQEQHHKQTFIVERRDGLLVFYGSQGAEKATEIGKMTGIVCETAEM